MPTQTMDVSLLVQMLKLTRGQPFSLCTHRQGHDNVCDDPSWVWLLDMVNNKAVIHPRPRQ